MSLVLQLIELIQMLLPRIRSRQYYDHVYLSQANNVADLERRMHELDQRNSQAASWRAFGPDFM
ncbi:MAG: DUF3563 family protein [Comamonadaceae bacterium]|nr:DUF3563 family protein [Comamonadaceae bacterium]